METFHRVLVALDLSIMDRKLLQYTAMITPVLDAERIYFLHVMPDFSMPKNLDVEFHSLFAPEYPVDEKVRDKIALDVQEILDDSLEVDFKVEVVEGSPYEKLIHWTKVKEIDLLLVGHKAVSEGSGITPKRVARRSTCNVLFVPDEGEVALRKILVPLDFSENSLRALRTALKIKKRLDDEPEISCIYIVDMPPADYYIRPFYESGYRQVLMDSAHKAYYNFLNENSIDDKLLAPPVFRSNDYSNVAAHLHEYIDDYGTDLVIMGAQGHTAFEKLIYGSVTEKLVEKCKQTPILIVR